MLYVGKLVLAVSTQTMLDSVVGRAATTKIMPEHRHDETRYLLNHHQLVHSCRQRVAHAIDVIARQVDKHHLRNRISGTPHKSLERPNAHVFGTVFQRARQRFGQGSVFLCSPASFDCACNGMCDDSALLFFNE